MDKISVKISNIDPETKSNVIKVAAAVVVVGTTGYIIYYFYRSYSNTQLIKKKQIELAEKKKSLWTKLENLKTPIENMDKITNMKLNDLLAGIAAGTFKPIDVVQAFQAKALKLDKEYNFITDLNPDVDQEVFNLGNIKKGSLKGIPVSIKECFMVQGCDSTHGMLDRTFAPADRDDMMVKTIKLQGMIPFLTTNMCQTGYSIECSNPIYGETVNPYSKTRTCGGSSGGEGAILSTGASILGLGSDIGGSIRIPSYYCGIFGLKPTSHRFSHRYSKPLFADQNIINVSVGPMARSIEDLVTFFKALACGDLYHLDPYCPPLCFNDKIFEKKKPLRIGFYTHLGETQVHPVPAVVRAVNMARKALETVGHQIVEFSIPDIDYAIFSLYFACLFTDGGVGFLDHFMKRNPVDPSIALTTKLLRLPKFLKYILSGLVYPIDKNFSRILCSTAGYTSIYSLWELKDKVNAYREKVLSKWQEERLDGMLCPVLPICAPPLRTSGYIVDIIGYTCIYNLLDYPAGTVPVTKVTQADIDALISTYPRDKLTHRRIVEYQKESLGMPVGVQCVSMLWREETCLRIMRDITENLS